VSALLSTAGDPPALHSFPTRRSSDLAAADAIAADINQYAVTWGSKDLREAIAGDCASRLGMAIDPDRQITVCCGSTEAMIATLRSEEHTSELQSRENLVCRLLLEKKK